ncbi:uncharacterized protein LOC103833396 [Brassica rapa]|nr:uncharacterized protein LOC103833396 [Brassica rapa]XP_048593353.1 small polypeptide DEVIL 9 [Brassica napus]
MVKTKAWVGPTRSRRVQLHPFVLFSIYTLYSPISIFICNLNSCFFTSTKTKFYRYCSLETCLYMSNPSSSKPNRKTSFGDRCLLMAKQQRTRLYILRRCVSMLLCWHDHSISD